MGCERCAVSFREFGGEGRSASRRSGTLEQASQVLQNLQKLDRPKSRKTDSSYGTGRGLMPENV
jgi:hypothetical protein